MESKIYEWYDELGEPPRAKLKSTGEIVELRDIAQGAVIEFPVLKKGSFGCYEIGTTREVVINGETRPTCYVETIRRAKDGIGIELINRGQARRNWQGNPIHTIEGLNDPLDKFLHNGDGYKILNELLQKCEM